MLMLRRCRCRHTPRRRFSLVAAILRFHADAATAIALMPFAMPAWRLR